MTDEESLAWPAGVERTPARDREAYPHGFGKTQTQSIKSILDELNRMDAVGVKIETAGPHRTDNPHYPYKDASPDDPGVVVRWKMGGREYVAPCDRWDNLRDNARAIALHLNAMRGTERWGVETLQGRFEAQALPPGDDATPAGEQGPHAALSDPPHEVLGVSPDAPTAVVEAAAKALRADHHPDTGGDREAFIRVNKAEAMMKDGR